MELFATPDLSDKAALITGGASGLGAAIAEGMAAVGARVTLVDKDEDGLHAMQERLHSQGGDCRIVPVDLRDETAPARIVEKAVALHESLSIVVHSAGIHGQAAFATMAASAFDDVFAVNVRAPYFLTQSCLSHLTPGSSVIFVGSTGAVAAIPGGFSAYCSSKGAVHSLMRALAVELGPLGRTRKRAGARSIRYADQHSRFSTRSAAR